MKNVMKNILLLCYALSITSNLDAMNAPKLTPRYLNNGGTTDRKKATVAKPSGNLSLPPIAKKLTPTVETMTPRAVATTQQPSALAGSGDQKSVTAYDAFFTLCEQDNDYEALKKCLVDDSISLDDIKKAHKALDAGTIKNILLLVYYFLTTNRVAYLDEAIHKNRRSITKRFVLLRLIPRRFETAVQFGHIEIIKHLLEKYSEQLDTELIKKMLRTVISIISTKYKTQAQAYILIRKKLKQEIAQRRAVEGAEIDQERAEQFETVIQKFDEMGLA